MAKRKRTSPETGRLPRPPRQFNLAKSLTKLKGYSMFLDALIGFLGARITMCNGYLIQARPLYHK